ncbi:hypothetical protein Tco_0981448 [Tanacetum coccineum]
MGNGRGESPHNKTTQYYDKHRVPPTKRLFKVAMLDQSPNLLVHGERLEIWDYQLCAIWKDLDYNEWSTPAGFKLARENLQSRVKEEDSITNVENAVFDLGVMDSLWPSKLCAPTQSVDDMPFLPYTNLYGVHAVRKAQSASSNISDQEAQFSPTVLSRFRFKPRLDTSTCPLVCG